VAEHEQRKECADRFAKNEGLTEKLFALSGEKVSWTVFKWLFGAVVAGATAAIVCLLFLHFQAVSESGAAISTVRDEVTRRGPIIETQSRNIDKLSEDVRFLDKSVQTLVDSGSPQLKTVSEKIDGIDRRLAKVELLLAPRPGSGVRDPLDVKVVP
jgi:hypothetical protein